MGVTSSFALAAHAVALLAFSGEEGATSSLIASSATTHPARVRRVLGLLVRAGIVRGREGAGGGYVLARPAHEITLAEVFQATRSEGPLLPFHPRPPNTRCPIGAGITAALGTVDDDLGTALRDALAHRTVAWLTERAVAAAGMAGGAAGADDHADATGVAAAAGVAGADDHPGPTGAAAGAASAGDHAGPAATAPSRLPPIAGQPAQ